MCECVTVVVAFIQRAKIINKSQPPEWLLHLMLYSHNPVYDNFGFVRSQKYNKSISLSDQKTVSKNLHSTRNAKCENSTLHYTSLLTSLPQLSQLQLEHLVAASLPAAAIKFLPGLQLPPWSCDLVMLLWGFLAADSSSIKSQCCCCCCLFVCCRLSSWKIAC